MIEPISTFLENTFTVGNLKLSIYNVLLAIIVLILGWLANRLIRKQLLQRIWAKNQGVSNAMRFSVTITIRYIVSLLTIVVAVNVLGINIGLIIAGLTALLFGLGIGIQNLFNDLISGFILLFDDSLSIGDIVEVDGMIGEVIDINLRTTRLKTNERIVFIIPNSRLTASLLVNYSNQSAISYFTLSVGVAYGSDTKKVKRLLLEAAAEIDEVLQWPKPRVRFDDFGNSSLDFSLFFATKRNLQIEFIRSDIRFIIDAKFRDNDVRIPFPQRDLHMRSDLTQNIH